MATTSCIGRLVVRGRPPPGSSSPGCAPSCRSACESRSSSTACPTLALRCTSTSARSPSRTPVVGRPTMPSSRRSSNGCTTSDRAPSWSPTIAGWQIGSSASAPSIGGSIGSRTHSISNVVDHGYPARHRRPSADRGSGSRGRPPAPARTPTESPPTSRNARHGRPVVARRRSAAIRAGAGHRAKMRP